MLLILAPKAMKLHPHPASIATGRLRLLDWGSGACVESNPGMDLASPLAFCGGSGDIVCSSDDWAAPNSVLVRTHSLFLSADRRQPALFHLCSKRPGAIPRHTRPANAHPGLRVCAFRRD